MQMPLPNGWEERWDPVSNAHYYFCHMTNSTQWERPGQPPPPPYPPPDTYEEAPPHTMTHTSTVPSVKSMPYGETLGVIPTGLPIHPANQPPMVAEPYRPPTLVPAIPPPPPGPIPGATMHLGGMMQPPPPPMVIPTTPGGYQVATAVVSDSTSSPVSPTHTLRATILKPLCVILRASYMNIGAT
mmetsp:Transcript_11636/g.32409  ORF Transcript_11636/g.32409 Transcript_11636/m.32409 type:complete len:185 (-) Transcript_11636:62-616(-)